MTELTIDGSLGEGGGQVLRSSLTLAALTQTPVRIHNIRAGRKKSGLLAQHLTCVKAVAELTDAEVTGAELRSGEIRLTPKRPAAPGHYEFAVSTAGSAHLVLQTVLPLLMSLDSPSTLKVSGGTHNGAAPPSEFLDHAFFPALARLGPVVRGQLHRHGFAPKGGGVSTFTIEPSPLARVVFPDRGELESIDVVAKVARLKKHIAQRELNVLRSQLQPTSTTALEVDSPGPGNVVVAIVKHTDHSEVFTGFGRQGIRAESVARGVGARVSHYLGATATVAHHLADQLLIPMAIAGGGQFTTLEPTAHTRTNAAIIERFLPVSIGFEELSPDLWSLSVSAAGG